MTQSYSGVSLQCQSTLVHCHLVPWYQQFKCRSIYPGLIENIERLLLQASHWEGKSNRNRGRIVQPYLIFIRIECKIRFALKPPSKGIGSEGSIGFLMEESDLFASWSLPGKGVFLF
jgi:hypothetical protein